MHFPSGHLNMPTGHTMSPETGENTDQHRDGTTLHNTPAGRLHTWNMGKQTNRKNTIMITTGQQVYTITKEKHILVVYFIWLVNESHQKRTSKDQLWKRVTEEPTMTTGIHNKNGNELSSHVFYLICCLAIACIYDLSGVSKCVPNDEASIWHLNSMRRKGTRRHKSE